MDNIKINLKELGWETMDCSNLAYGPVAGCCEHSDGLLVLIRCTELVD